MTFFESGRPRAPRSSGGFRTSADRRRRRTVTGSLVLSIASVASLAIVTLLGPDVFLFPANSGHQGRGDAVLSEPVAPPSAEVVAITDRAFLTEEGRALLYASRPRLASLAEVAEFCDRAVDDPPAGCFGYGEGIVIYQPADPRLADWSVDVLAHELLHAAYDTFDDARVAALDPLLETEIARVPADDPVHELIAWSVGEHEGNRATELFAYLGAQVELDGGFAPELEAIYARYFTDRVGVVRVRAAVEAAVTGVVDEMLAADRQLWNDRVTNQNARSQLDADRSRHEQARQNYNDNVAQYDAMGEDQRARTTIGWRGFDGVEYSAPIGEGLQTRLGQLESYRVTLDERAAALAAAEASVAEREAGLKAQRADAKALWQLAYPGSSFE